MLRNLKPIFFELRLPHTSLFFVVELQIFLLGSNRVKICRDISLLAAH